MLCNFSLQCTRDKILYNLIEIAPKYSGLVYWCVYNINTNQNFKLQRFIDTFHIIAYS